MSTTHALLVPAPHGCRLGLSRRGRSTEQTYRARVGRGRSAGAASARSEWAETVGLQPSDGFYLAELARRTLTMDQLGEAVAIHSQSQQMVHETIGRLVGLGLVEVVPAG